MADSNSGKSVVSPKDAFKGLHLKPIFTPATLALKYKKPAKKEKAAVQRVGEVFFPKIEAEDVIFLNMIGEGSFGQVWKARWKLDEYAFKIIPKALTKEEYEEIKTEVETMFACPHENVLRLVGASIDPKQNGKSCMIATELCDYSVTHKITNKIYNKFPLPYQVMKAKLEDAKSIAIGIQWIHEVNRISHGDLKPDNILVKKGVLKIADFGFAAFRDKAQTIDKRGTPYYMAPEVIKVKLAKTAEAKEYNPFKADIYAYSMILYCIFQGLEIPFPEFSAWAPFSSAVISGYRPKLDPEWPPLLRTLFEKCWADKAEDRPDWEEIVFLLNECIVDACSFNPKVRKFWKQNFFANNDDYFLESKVPWKKFAAALSHKNGVEVAALNAIAPLFLNHGIIPESDKALFDNYVTLEALDILALVFGSSFLSKKPKKNAAIEQLKHIAKSPFWHGVIDSGKANSRLAAEGRDKNCLLRCRHPRHSQMTGAPVTVSIRDGENKHIYVFFDESVDNFYHVFEGETEKTFESVVAVLEYFSKGFEACPRSASYSMQS